MTHEEITNGNKLIAEFCEFQNTSIGWFDSEEILSINGSNTFDELKFHSSWDWLMPVVEKISDICKANNSELYVKFYNGTRKELLIFRHTKDETWTLCVDFIEWYNQNKDNN